LATSILQFFSVGRGEGEGRQLKILYNTVPYNFKNTETESCFTVLAYVRPIVAILPKNFKFFS
jgi:hypothetical protein